MREKRRGWERGLYGVRGNKVEKEEGDLKRSRGGGGSESSALDRTRAELCGARAECIVGVLCGSMRASIHERNRACDRAYRYTLDRRLQKMNTQKNQNKQKHHKFYTNKHRIYTDKNQKTIKQMT
jgi:hypothetical protein